MLPDEAAISRPDGSLMKPTDWAFRPSGYDLKGPSLDHLIRGQAPGFGGGGFLPKLKPSEVEIAGLAFDSTTGDVISIRAASVQGGFRYRVVDEYGTRYRVHEPVRTAPLS